MHKRLKECSTVFHSLWWSETISSPFLTLPLSQITLPSGRSPNGSSNPWEGQKSDLVSPQCTTLHVGAPHPHYNRIWVKSEELLFRHDCDVNARVPSSSPVFGCCCCTRDPERSFTLKKKFWIQKKQVTQLYPETTLFKKSLFPW